MLIVHCASQVVLISQLIAAPPSLPRTLAPFHASLTLLLFTTAATTACVLIGDPCQRLEPGRARCVVGVAVGSGGRSARARAVGRRVERAAHDDVSSRPSDVYRNAVRSDQIRSKHQAGMVLSCVCVCCWRQTGPTWVFNPRREGSYLLVLLAAGDVGRIVGDEFVCGG